ncbi:MAG: serine/threonine-protein kinase [Nannocystaceae bacterium]
MVGDPDDLERQVTPLRPRTASATSSTRSLTTTASRRLRHHAAASERASALGAGTHVLRYVLLERLGRGGMGEVYRAYDPDLDRRLALKLLRDEREDGPHGTLDRERLRREAQTLAQLSHPNVVTIFDVGQWQHRVFIAMELIEGIHLGRWLRDQPRSLDEIIPVFLAAGTGLAAAHAAGIIHRDFKPANTMVGEDGRVCVLDFGLATGRDGAPDPAGMPPLKVAADGTIEDTEAGLTETGRTVGTPAYMAPEQHLGRAVDARSDQFSFCVSLFEAVAGRRPFPGSDISNLAKAKRLHHVAPLLDPSPMPPWLHEIIDRGLAAAPEDRHQSMDALLAAIETGYRRAQPRRAKRWTAVAAAVGAGGGALWWGLQQPSPCAQGEARAQQQWSEPRAAAVREAFTATRLGYADESYQRVARRLDGYTSEWATSYRQACEALDARSEDDAGLDQRMGCLDQRLEQLGATVDVLAEADPDTVRMAPEVVAALPLIERCEHRTTEGPPPPGPQLVGRVSTLRRRLATAKVLSSAGRYREALALARGVLADSSDLDYAPLQVEARYRVGNLQIEMGEGEAAERDLSEAAVAAQALEHDEIAVSAMTDLVLLLGEYLSRPEEGRTWASHARAVLQRNPDPRAEAHLLESESTTLMSQGDYEAARALSEQALELRRRTLGDDHVELVGSHNNMANALMRLGRFEQAQQQYERALVIAESSFGPDHPRIATLLLNIGGLMARQGKLEPALPILQRAVDIRRRSLGPEHPLLAVALNNLSAVLWESQQRERAVELLREALEIQVRALGPDDIKHLPLLNNLAEMSLMQQQVEEAAEHVRRAAALLDRFYEPGHPRRVSTLTLLGRIAMAQDDLPGGRAWLQEAIAVVEAQLGAEHPDSIQARMALGELELVAKRPKDAAESFGRSLQLMEAVGFAPVKTADARFGLARARTLAGDPIEQTRPLAEQAREASAEPERARIDAWLAAHPRP